MGVTECGVWPTSTLDVAPRSGSVGVSFGIHVSAVAVGCKVKCRM